MKVEANYEVSKDYKYRGNLGIFDVYSRGNHIQFVSKHPRDTNWESFEVKLDHFNDVTHKIKQLTRLRSFREATIDLGNLGPYALIVNKRGSYLVSNSVKTRLGSVGILEGMLNKIENQSRYSKTRRAEAKKNGHFKKEYEGLSGLDSNSDKQEHLSLEKTLEDIELDESQEEEIIY